MKNRDAFREKQAINILISKNIKVKNLKDTEFKKYEKEFIFKRVRNHFFVEDGNKIKKSYRGIIKPKFEVWNKNVFHITNERNYGGIL